MDLYRYQMFRLAVYPRFGMVYHRLKRASWHGDYITGRLPRRHDGACHDHFLSFIDFAVGMAYRRHIQTTRCRSSSRLEIDDDLRPSFDSMPGRDECRIATGGRTSVMAIIS